MKEGEVRERAFAMPLTSPAFPRGPYRFINREYIIITYRTDPQILRALVPEPLEPDGDLVKYEFIRMPDSKPGLPITGEMLRSSHQPFPPFGDL